MDFSILYSSLVLGELLLFLAGGVILILWGSRKHHLAFSGAPGTPRRGDQQHWQHLLTWQVIHPGDQDPAVLEEFSRSSDFLHSSGIIGGGSAVVLTVLGSAIISLLTTGTLLSLSAGNGYLLTATILFLLLLGYSLGYVLGVWQLRRLTAGRIAYGDLQQRKLSDYRSVWFPWIASILLACATLIPLALLPHLTAQISLKLLGGQVIEVSVWVLEAIPAAMLLTLVTGEVVMARIARLPRLLLTSNPHTAQRADNLLRAMTVGRVLGNELAAIGSLGVAQWIIMGAYVGPTLTSPGGWPSAALLFAAAFLFAGAVALGGLSLPVLVGRIGGKISGWPWQPVRTP